MRVKFNYPGIWVRHPLHFPPFGDALRASDADSPRGTMEGLRERRLLPVKNRQRNDCLIEGSEVPGRARREESRMTATGAVVALPCRGAYCVGAVGSAAGAAEDCEAFGSLCNAAW